MDVSMINEICSLPAPIHIGIILLVSLSQALLSEWLNRTTKVQASTLFQLIGNIIAAIMRAIFKRS